MSEYYMFNKPRGCVTARCDIRYKTVMDYFSEEKREVLFPVGRLDKDTEGLLIITDDGAFCEKLLNPENKVQKRYFFHAVYDSGKPPCESFDELENGIKIYKNKDTLTAPAKLDALKFARLADIKDLLQGSDLKLAERKPELVTRSGYITITEGKKHEVKRILMHFGARVVYLKRVSIGTVELDSTLPLGEYRALSNEETENLRK